MYWKTLAPIFIFSAGYDFFRNLIPREKPIYTERQSITYNDGYHLREMLFRQENRRQYKQALALLSQKQYAGAGSLFDCLARDNFRRTITHQLAIGAYWQAKETDKALELAALKFDINEQSIYSPNQLGILYSLAGRHEEALHIYTELLDKNPDDWDAQANIGFTRIVQQRYDEALAIFEKLLRIKPDDAYVLSQSGLIQYRKNGAPHGLEALQRALELNPENAYVLRNLAIYNFEQGNPSEAKTLFQRAYQLDPTAFEVEEYLGMLQ